MVTTTSPDARTIHPARERPIEYLRGHFNAQHDEEGRLGDEAQPRSTKGVDQKAPVPKPLPRARLSAQLGQGEPNVGSMTPKIRPRVKVPASSSTRSTATRDLRARTCPSLRCAGQVEIRAADQQELLDDAPSK